MISWLIRLWIYYDKDLAGGTRTNFYFDLLKGLIPESGHPDKDGNFRFKNVQDIVY